MADRVAEQRHELAVANRILANEGIIDAFGHISRRNPKDPSRYLFPGTAPPSWSNPPASSR